MAVRKKCHLNRKELRNYHLNNHYKNKLKLKPISIRFTPVKTNKTEKSANFIPVFRGTHGIYPDESGL
jgi:hypothetical protein